MKRIVMIVSAYYDILFVHLYEKTRKRNIITPRQVAIYLIKKRFNYSITSIAKHFNKNHATILHSIRTIENYIQVDMKFRQDIENIESIINSKSIICTPMVFSIDNLKNHQ